MNPDDIIRMAQEAGWEMGEDLSDGFGVRLARFAALVAAAEREACAKVCDGIRYSGYVPPEDGAAASYYDGAASDCADTIRARGNK
jgi:hypothetical protein